MSLIKAKIAKSRHVNYPEIIPSENIRVHQMNARPWRVLEAGANSTHPAPHTPSVLLTLCCEKPITRLHQQLIPHHCREDSGPATMNGVFARENERR